MEIINELLKERKMTKQQLAAKMGVKRENLQRMISTNGNPTLSNLQKIAAALNVELWQLFTGSGNMIAGAVYYRNEVYKISSKSDLENLINAIE